MPKRRAQIRMSPRQVAIFLKEESTATLATIGRRGHPHLVAMWYVVLDGAPAFWTFRKSQKIQNLRRDARISCLVEAGQEYDELRGVHMQGRGVIHEDSERVIEFGTALYSRYLPDLDQSDARRRAVDSSSKRVLITMDVERTVSWDHRKLDR